MKKLEYSCSDCMFSTYGISELITFPLLGLLTLTVKRIDYYGAREGNVFICVCVCVCLITGGGSHMAIANVVKLLPANGRLVFD